MQQTTALNRTHSSPNSPRTESRRALKGGRGPEEEDPLRAACGNGPCGLSSAAPFCPRYRAAHPGPVAGAGAAKWPPAKGRQAKWYRGSRIPPHGAVGPAAFERLRLRQGACPGKTGGHAGARAFFAPLRPPLPVPPRRRHGGKRPSPDENLMGASARRPVRFVGWNRRG